ncbi:sodium/glutamate symporter [Ferrimonas balearica DSM 9799]|uniref:Sodium/glutamate symporter n=1 Tax=Ferrimonas balearica (strain DSM 9799 / CCM 4581 / KCTC 23876 / PAT) TaxID=550540 RepID=E1SRC0_FERBD|nr:sodium:glutamate symporter [Ferrimonas balearica]ADN74885.1 sodium/glutamate symporter [Ferrimonas balearica DSM 9799]
MITNWELFTDFGIAGGLLLCGKLLRAHITLLQKLYLPAALIAGLLALLLGSAGLDWLPWSEQFASNASILTVVLFASLGLATDFPSARTLVTRCGSLWTFNQLANVGQWAFCALMGLALMTFIWPGLSPAFGLVLSAGFMGGHGTGVVVGETLGSMGWEDALTLALTTATVGIFVSILVGLLLIHLGLRKGWITDFARFETMSKTARKGLVPADEQGHLGRETAASISIDALAMHAALLIAVSVAAYHAAVYLSGFHELVRVPAFVTAFGLGLAARTVLKKLGGKIYFDDKIFGHCTGTASDFLVVFGIAAIKITILLNYAVPLILMVLLGIVFNLMMVLVVAPRILGENWFEKAVFSWGWLTGTVGMGIALLRIVDPKMRSRVLDDYAIAYVPGSLVDMVMISLVPVLMMKGMAFEAISGMLIYLLCIGLMWRVIKRRQAALQPATA